MNLITIAQANNWAIVPEKLDAIHQVLFNHMKGQTPDLTAFEAQAKRLEGSRDTLVTEDGLAIVPVRGVLAKRMNLMTQFSGGTSTQVLMNDFKQALEDDDVSAILLDIDSPGGTVDGTEAIADLVYESRGVKPIVAFVNGMMASAAYWIGSAADTIIAEETGEVGSVGVVQIHYDYSRADEKRGVKRSMIYAGKYKTMGNDSEPLSADAKDYLQQGVDYVYSIFVNTVSRNRGVSVETVLKDMAEGRLFMGRQALDAGLIDTIGNFDLAVETALSMSDAQGTTYTTFKPGAVSPDKEGAMALGKKSQTAESAPMTVEQLTAAHPDLVEQIRAQGAESVNVKGIQEAAVTSERERILGLAAVQFGEEDGEKFKAVVETGVTVEQFKSIQATQPAQSKKLDKQEEMLEAIKGAGAPNPGAGDTVNSSTTGKDFMAQVTAHMQQHGCSKGQAMQAVQAQDPKAHRAWIMSQQGGSTVH